jgi:hypothetical protein
MAGILFLGIGKVPHMKLMFWKFLASNPSLFSVLGTSLIAVGALLFVIVFTLYKKVFYQVKMNAQDVQINPGLIETYVKKCMQEVFLKSPSYCEVVVRKDQTLEILTKLSSSSMEEHEKALALLEKKIGDLLKEKIGYQKEFFLTVSVE